MKLTSPHTFLILGTWIGMLTAGCIFFATIKVSGEITPWIQAGTGFLVAFSAACDASVIYCAIAYVDLRYMPERFENTVPS